MVVALFAGTPGRGQGLERPPDGSVNIYAAASAWDAIRAKTSGLRWTVGCFPRCGCPDDYTANPYPRQCWPPYPAYYRCVPAGAGGLGKEKLTWWFLPTPQALREALWCQP
jgi:hypothetical protein